MRRHAPGLSLPHSPHPASHHCRFQGVGWGRGHMHRIFLAGFTEEAGHTSAASWFAEQVQVTTGVCWGLIIFD